VNADQVADLTRRFALGVGPAPRSWEMPREAALGMTAVCNSCGDVYFVTRGHRCSKPRRTAEVTR
jgi:hypothetical protein